MDKNNVGCCFEDGCCCCFKDEEERVILDKEITRIEKALNTSTYEKNEADRMRNELDHLYERWIAIHSLYERWMTSHQKDDSCKTNLVE